MRPRAPTLVAAGQVCFVVALGVCVALHPGFVLKRNEGGVSEYGVHAVTAVPYSLAYLLDAALVTRAARLLGPDRAALRRYLVALAALLTLTLVTTYAYTRSTELRDVHFGVGAALVLFECAGGSWLARGLCGHAAAWVALIAVGAGLVGCALATFGVWHVLFAGQVLVTAGFATLVTAATRAAAT